MLTVALLASLAPLASFALAHEGEYDPLVLDLHGYLTADGKLSDAAPAPGVVAFPAPAPPAPATALRFAMPAPVRFAPGAPFVVTLTIRADELVVARDADGDAFEVNVEPSGTATRVAIEAPVMAPGTVATLSASVQAPSALYEEGDPVTLTIRPLMAFTSGALSLVVGGEAGSTFDSPSMRVPTPADLRLQDVPHTEFLIEGESFDPPATHAVNVFVVGHDSVTPPPAGAWSANGTYVVLRGEEPAETASQHELTSRDARVEAAHEFRVNGVLARVHPGLAVVVRANALPIRVECERNCAPLAWSYAPPSAATPADTPSVLVAPPRDTSGIPVSEDEPAGKATPFPIAFVLVALLVAALGRR